jgi:hypothetical protein
MSCDHVISRGLLVLGVIMAGAALTLSAPAEIPNFTPIVDGTVDAGYGTAVALQTIQTSFGDHPGGVLAGGGGELDGLHLANDTDTLYVMMSGNEEMNFNAMLIFIDNVANATGDVATLENVSGGDTIFEDTGNGIGGMVLPDGFNADLIVALKTGINGAISPVNAATRIQAADYVADAVTFDNVPDLDTGANVTTEASFSVVVSNTVGAGSILYAVDNSNGAGVDGANPGNNVPPASAEAVTTGIETGIPLSLIPGSPGPGDDLQIFVAYASGDGNFFSNQTLPNVGGPQSHYATDPDFSSAGIGITPAGVTLGTAILPFTDDFNSAASSAEYHIIFATADGGVIDDNISDGLLDLGAAGVTDGELVFGFDYSGTIVDTINVALPAAPNTPDATTLGLFIRVNLDDELATGVSLFPRDSGGSPLNIPDTLDYRLEADMWVNAASSGTTENPHFGLFHSGTIAALHSGFLTPNASQSDGVQVTVFGDVDLGGDGDYAVLFGDAVGDPVRQPDSVFAANDDDGSHIFYAGVFPEPPHYVAGGPANRQPAGAWVEVELRKEGSQVTWLMQNTVIATVDNTSGFTTGAPMLGYYDYFDGSGDESSNLGFLVLDNFRVTEILGPTAVEDFTLYR